VVELDRCATDMFEAVKRSHDYLVANGFAKGRLTSAPKERPTSAPKERP